jgi:hypothetical protein
VKVSLKSIIYSESINMKYRDCVTDRSLGYIVNIFGLSYSRVKKQKQVLWSQFDCQLLVEFRLHLIGTYEASTFLINYECGQQLELYLKA